MSEDGEKQFVIIGDKAQAILDDQLYDLIEYARRETDWGFNFSYDELIKEFRKNLKNALEKINDNPARDAG